MKIDFKLDNSLKETHVTIMASELNDEVNELIRKLTESVEKPIVGLIDEKVIMLKKEEIIKFYGRDQKVFASTPTGDYQIKKRLYELEEQLAVDKFIRISNSEIINLRKVKYFDMNMFGTICAVMVDGSRSFVSRRNMKKVKDTLGV